VGGRGSTTNENDRWPNVLARRLLSRPATAHVAVLNQGIGGNRVLRDGLGPSVVSRIDRDVLSPPGVRWLVVLAGINDLGTATDASKRGDPHATAEDLIAAFDGIVERVRSKGIVVYGATILPFEGSFYFSAESERERQRVNGWIRTSGRFDAVIDFDAITRDPTAPTRLSPEVDGGDHLHPSAAGYRMMADAVDPALFEQ
jgi:lysophospholipase L1-like esterase